MNNLTADEPKKSPLSRFSFRKKRRDSCCGRGDVPQPNDKLVYLTQEETENLFMDLMDEHAFEMGQLIELSGYSVAVSLYKTYTQESFGKSKPSILVCCGPGKNGGVGLVAARHLKWFGYDPTVFCPRQVNDQFLHLLVKQCQEMEIPFLSFLPEPQLIADCYNVLLDAIFGFRFRPPIRPEMTDVIEKLKKVQTTPICSVDVPSGWHVSDGWTPGDIEPETLISLGIPKKCARTFRGKHHWLAGRFIPPSLATKYQLNLPTFPGTDPCVQLAHSNSNGN